MKDRELAIVMADFKKDPDRGEDIGIYGAVKRYMEKHGRNRHGGECKRLSIESWQHLRSPDDSEKRIYVPPSLPTDLPDLRLTRVRQVRRRHAGRKARQANLAMLVQKAEDYEKTSYQGLFDFIRYIEKLKKYNTDFGEAPAPGNMTTRCGS